MRTLHALPIAFFQHVLWFGANFRCADTYHRGYDHERTDRSSHSECAPLIWNDIHDYAPPHSFYRCDCPVCIERAPTNAHYTTNHGLEYGDPWRVDPELNPHMSVPVCENCRSGNHPVAPEGTT